jgi:TrmH family RNA methyltransferase
MENRIARDTCREHVDLTNGNAVVDLIASLKKGSTRAMTGLYFVEGVKMVREAIMSGASIEAIVVSPEMCPRKDILPVRWIDVAEFVVEVPRKKYEKAAQHFALKQGTQGIGALVRQSWTAIEQFVPPPDGVAVALCSVQDAGNVGTVLRTCDAVGCTAAFILGETADPYGPASVRASLGSILGHRLIKCDIPGLAWWASCVGATLVGTSPRADKSYRELQYRRPTVLMLGSEANGLTDEEMASCHEIVSIPMSGRRDSLNVAVAGAVVLYEVFHQITSEHSREGSSNQRGVSWGTAG